MEIMPNEEEQADKSPRSLDDFDTTADIRISQDPLERVIGQDEAVRLARIAASQRRHFLLVGPPGTGKSMIAQALSLHLSRPTEEIRVVHNPENPERPLVGSRALTRSRGSSNPEDPPRESSWTRRKLQSTSPNDSDTDAPTVERILLPRKGSAPSAAAPRSHR